MQWIFMRWLVVAVCLANKLYLGCCNIWGPCLGVPLMSYSLNSFKGVVVVYRE